MWWGMHDARKGKKKSTPPRRGGTRRTSPSSPRGCWAVGVCAQQRGAGVNGVDENESGWADGEVGAFKVPFEILRARNTLVAS